MDTVVQQNAANAEESASASAEMNAQSGRMKGLVSELKTLISGSNGSAMASGNAKRKMLTSRRENPPVASGKNIGKARLRRPERKTPLPQAVISFEELGDF